VKKLQEAISEDVMEKRSKTSRKGVEGCCGRGCNGCLMFWNDPEYARARETSGKEEARRDAGARYARGGSGG